ncbi:DUF4913 domain-containing protein [Nocardia carnea]|uniref:DUF4913 domain-containing protein n=1 Tax=Nocardia carnea TaxID=37328 RepID=UPI002453E3C3|nr:DUF4913 domain-containing protein [Nocardia carnea]
MSGGNRGASGNAGKSKAPPPPYYGSFVAFAERWLLPFVQVRLGEANREQTYTWCSRWWSHRAVAVRVAHLHSAFEASRIATDAGAFSSFCLDHVDPHIRYIMDAANGPLHRCNRSKHVPSTGLPADPVPPGWFGQLPTTVPESTDGQEDEPPLVRFANYVDFTEQWLLPVISVRLVGKGREGGYTWCRQWWRHRSVVLRIAALHTVFEASRRSDDRKAMSILFTRHIDRHMSSILDAAKGPLHRCTPDSHDEVAGLPFASVPLGWFAPDALVPVEDRGFGPDYTHLRERPSA